MAKTGVKIEGLDKLIGKVERLPERMVKEIDEVMEAGAMDIVSQAKRRAPVDLGFLKNGISFFKVGPLSFEVVSSAHYSPFVEFGTGAYVNVPQGLEDYAVQFKGQGIKQVNLPPQPFFFPSFEAVKPIIIKEIKEIIATLK